MVVRKDVLLVFLAGIVCSFSFGAFQFYAVKASASNSSGAVFYLFSIPVQIFFLSRFFFKRSVSHNLENKIFLLYCLLMVVSLVAIFCVYFQFGGRF